MMKAVIMAGGKGTRLRSVSGDDLPKPMVPVNGKPILEHQIVALQKAGVRDFVLVVGYKKERIMEYFQDGTSFDTIITYVEEEEPLGTAGALFYLKDQIKEDFLLVYGDVIFDIDVARMVRFHRDKKAEATLFAHPNNHPYDSDLLVLDDDSRVTNFDFADKTAERDYYYHNCVNAGFYVFSPEVLQRVEAPKRIDLEKTLLYSMMREQRPVYGYRSTEYIKDVGRPERLLETEQALMKGIVAAKNLKEKQKAFFLDRDGTINAYEGLISEPRQLRLLEPATTAIKRINESGWLCFVVTNQPVVARGLCTMDAVEEIHKKLETELGKKGCYVDGILFCPHHPDKGYPEENQAYKIDCKCRKPKTGMLDKCFDEYNIDRSASWMIGDTTVDIKTGINAGVRTALVMTGEAGNDRKYDTAPEITAKDLQQAIEQIDPQVNL